MKKVIYKKGLISSFCARQRNACHHAITMFFEKVGRYIARKPIFTIILSLFLSFALSSLTIFMGHWDPRFEYRDTMRSAPSFKTFINDIIPNFGNMPRLARLNAMSSNDDSMLIKENLLASLKIQNDVLALTASNEDKVISFNDICLKKSGRCTYDSIFMKLRWNETILERLTQQEIDTALIAAAQIPEMSLKSLLGNLQISENSKSIFAEEIQFSFFGESPVVEDTSIFGLLTGRASSELLKNANLWEGGFLEYTCAGSPCATNIQEKSSWDRNKYTVTGIAARSFTDEISRVSTDSMVYSVLSIIMILIIMWLFLGGKPLRDSRFSLGAGAVATILLSVTVGFGITSLVGIPLSELSLILLFIVFGVGVDDIIIIVDFLDRQNEQRQISPIKTTLEEEESTRVEIMASAVGGAGPAIFLTSISNLLAFCVAATVDFAGVRWFCIAGGIILFVLFVLTVTFFTAILVIDERRRARKGLDCFCCITYGKNEENMDDQDNIENAEETPYAPKSNEVAEHTASVLADAEIDDKLLAKVGNAWIRLLSNRIISSTIVMIFLLALPIGIGIVVPKLILGSEFEAYFPDDSYFPKYFSDTEESYERLGAITNLFFKEITFDDSETRTHISQIVSAMNEDNVTISPYQSMFQDYDDYVLQSSSKDSSSTEPFYERFYGFLKIKIPTCVRINSDFVCERIVTPNDYNTDVIWSDDNDYEEKYVTIIRMNGIVESANVVSDGIRIMDQHKETLRNALEETEGVGIDNVVVWTWSYLFSERDKKMQSLLAQTLIFTAITVLIVVAFFLHPVSVLIIAACIAFVDGSLFIIMYLTKIPIDVISFLSLTMSIGLSVDYIVHVAHAFERSLGNSTKERLADALLGTGKSVAKGGVSTFMGIFVLAFAKAESYRVFFKLLFSTIILGLAGGLIFFPACIMLVGKWIPLTTSHNDEKERDGTK